MAKRDLILNNFWWKVTSLLLAMIVWFVVHGTDSDKSLLPTAQKTFSNHPLGVMREAADKRAIRITPTEVTVIVTAPIGTQLRDSDIQTFIDLNEIDMRQGRARIRVFVPRDRGVRLQEVIPEEATLEFLE